MDEELCEHYVEKGHCIICDNLADVVMYCEICQSNTWHKASEDLNTGSCIKCNTTKRNLQKTDKDFMIGVD